MTDILLLREFPIPAVYIMTSKTCADLRGHAQFFLQSNQVAASIMKAVATQILHTSKGERSFDQTPKYRQQVQNGIKIPVKTKHLYQNIRNMARQLVEMVSTLHSHDYLWRMVGMPNTPRTIPWLPCRCRSLLQFLGSRALPATYL